MSIEKDRLISLIEFAQQSARMRSKPALNVTDHGIFALFEHQVQGLPGVQLDANGTEGDDEVWFSVRRLHETKPPDVTNATLKPWLHLTQNPLEETQLRSSSDSANLPPDLLAARREQGKAVTSPPPTVSLSDYDKADEVRTLFSTYLDTQWRPWARMRSCVERPCVFTPNSSR